MFAALFIAPVRGNAILSVLMHLWCADLHLQGTLVIIDHSCMQGLIKVIFWRCDVIIKLTGDRPPMCVDDPQGGVTGRNIWNDEPNSSHVPHQIEWFSFFHHLPVNGINVFGAPAYFRFDIVIFK